MPRKAFRGLDEDEEQVSKCLEEPRSGPVRKAFRGFDDEEDYALLSFAASLPLFAFIAVDIYIALSLAARLFPLNMAELPTDFVAEGIYLIVTTAIACAIDFKALLAMFFASEVKMLNWAAATGVVCSVLKLSIVNKVKNYDSLQLPSMSLAYDLVSGELQLNPLLRAGSEWHVESFYGSVCCAYLATYFAMSVLYNGEFCIDRVAKKMMLYSISSIGLGMFSGLFAAQSSMGWLLVAHALLVAWAVTQCRNHDKIKPFF